MFTISYTTYPRFSEEHKLISPGHLVQLLSDVMEQNAESYGAGAEYHHKRGLFWVLVAYEITIHRMPKIHETILVGTLPYSFKKMIGYRIYDIRDEHHNLLVEGKGKFMLMDVFTKSITVPDQPLLDLFVDAHKDGRTLTFEKYTVEKQQVLKKTQITIGLDHLDLNNHVNNAVYVMLATTYLHKPLPSIKKIHVHYKKETFLDQTLILTYYEEKNGIYVEMHVDRDIVSTVYFVTKTTTLDE